MGATGLRDRARQARFRQPSIAEADNRPPRPLGQVLSVSQFWALMERWCVPDTTALELIHYPGQSGTSGKRPRFRLSTRQQRITSYLAEVDSAIAAARKDAEWLHRKISAAPFARLSPIDHMVARGMDGAADVLRALNRLAMRAALRV
jgi:hypothetical protein